MFLFVVRLGGFDKSGFCSIWIGKEGSKVVVGVVVEMGRCGRSSAKSPIGSPRRSVRRT